MQVLDSLKKTLHERLTSPFTGSFIVSWIIVNWQFVLVLVSNEKYAQKVTTFKTLYPSAWPLWLYLVIFPFVGATFYVTVYQGIIAGSLWVWLWIQNKRREYVEKIKLYSKDEVDSMKKNLNDIIAEMENTIESSQRTATRQQNIAENLAKNLAAKEVEADKLSEDLMLAEKIANDKTTRYDVLSNELEEMRTELESKNKECIGLLEDRKKMLSKLEALQGNLAGISNQLDAEKTRSSNLELALEHKKDKLEHLLLGAIDQLNSLRYENLSLSDTELAVKQRNLSNQIRNFENSKVDIADREILAGIRNLLRNDENSERSSLSYYCSKWLFNNYKEMTRFLND